MTRLGPAARAGPSTAAGAVVGAVATALTQTITWPLVSGLAVCVLGIIGLEYWSRSGTPAPAAAPQATSRTRYEEHVTGHSQVTGSAGRATRGAEVTVRVTGGSSLTDSPTTAQGDAEASRTLDDHSTVKDSPVHAQGEEGPQPGPEAP
ncbi:MULTISPECIES: hypothetical protein [Streptomyces]|uniref:hypothetical protein n=1 Tax=Streptomyces TaxID=1883 RepID=UPI000ABF82CB|nr:MULTISPECIES: hypothetical protein [Streptomyces]